MAEKKDIIIQTIISEFEQLSGLILTQLDLLNNIIENYSDDIPNKIIEKLFKNEKLIDNFEIELDAKIVNAIVLYKPVATELRQLFAIYRMVINLERIGDRVIKIMNFMINIKDKDVLKSSSPMIQPMLKLTSQMVSKALISYTNKDTEYAWWTIKKDETIDELYRKLLKKSIKKSELPKEFQTLLVTLSDIRAIISSIERIGDQATNIAETSIYATLGKDVRHQKNNTDYED